MDHQPRVLAIFRGLPGCGAGGPLHIVIDDENILDQDLAFCRDVVERRDHWTFGEAPTPAAREIIAQMAMAILDLLQPMRRSARLRWVRQQNGW